MGTQPGIREPRSSAPAGRRDPASPNVASDRVLAGAMLAFALVIRLLVAADARDAPYWTATTLDERVCLESARGMLAGKLPPHGAYYTAPGYAWLLGLVLASGGGLVVAKILNLVAGACGVALVAVLAWRSFGRGAAIAAGVLWALYPSELLQELLLLKSALSVLLVLAALVAISRGVAVAGARSPVRTDRTSKRLASTSSHATNAGPARWAAAGLCLGLATLLRPELLVAATFLAVAAVVARMRGWPGAPRPPALVLFAVAVVGTVGVPTIQNLRRSGDVVVVAYGGGPNFYMGNHRGAQGGYEPLRPERSDPLLEESDAVLLANTSAGRTLSPAAVSRYWYARGLDWWRADPGGALRLTIKKWALLWGPRELADGVSTRLAGRWVAALRNRLVGPALVLPAALVGLWLTRRRRELWPHQALIIGMQVAIVPFFLFERFRLPLVAASLPFAAAAAAAAWRALRARRWLRLGAGATATLAIAAVLAQARVPNDENAHRAHLGSMLYDSGRYQEALREFEAVRAAAPDYWRLDDNIAASYAALHDYDRAAAAVESFLRHLHDEEARTGLAPAEELTYGHSLAGELDRVRDRLAEAEANYRTALRYAPPEDRARLHANLEAIIRLRTERESTPRTRDSTSSR